MNDSIERAIDAAAAKNGEPTGPQIVQAGLHLINEALELPPDGGIRFNQLEEHAEQPRVLLLDVNAGAWRPVILPPGTWSLQPAADQEPPRPKPRLWTPS